MKWNVIVKDLSTGIIGPYNIFDCADFRIAVEKIIAQKYDKTRFLEELDREADYCFRAQIEWETFFTTWPPYIGAEEINRIIKEFYCTEVEVMFYLNQWKDAFKSESFTAKNIRTDRQTEVLPVGKKHYAVIVAFLALRYMSIS